MESYSSYKIYYRGQMSKMQKNLKDQKKIIKSPFNDYWHKINYTFLILSMIVLITGYYFMTNGAWNSTLSMSVSPVILLIVYLILIPLAIFLKPSSKQNCLRQDLHLNTCIVPLSVVFLLPFLIISLDLQ